MVGVGPTSHALEDHAATITTAAPYGVRHERHAARRRRTLARDPAAPDSPIAARRGRLRVRGAGARARRAHARRRPRLADGARPDPARHAQPARPGRGRDRHRQDQDPAAARRAAERARRAGLRRGHQGRPLRLGDARAPAARRSPPAPPRSGRRGPPPASRSSYYALGGQGTGIPLRATMSSFGPTLLSKVLGLNDTQESSLGLVFHYADHAGLPLLDLADLRAVVQHLTSDEGKADLKELGGLSERDGRGDPARADRLRRPGRRRVLRRARVRVRRPAPAHPRRARPDQRWSSCRTCRTARPSSRRS